jgi:uncharacterized protein
VIALDTNILVYAHRKNSPFYDIARAAMTSLSEGSAAWALPWPCVHEFLSVVTNSRIFSLPTASSEALDQIDAWLESPSVVLLAESGQHWPELRAIVLAARVTGRLIHDARIAALCKQHGVRELWSADRDFSRFPDLNVVNPLVR